MTTTLTYIGHTTGHVGAAGSLTLGTPGGMTDGSALVACIMQASDSPITPPAGWTGAAVVDGDAITTWVRDWATGDPTSYTWATGDAAVGMLIAIGNADISRLNNASIPSGGTDATKIECPSLSFSVADPYRPFAYIGFGAATSQSGAFVDFQYGDALITEVTDAGKTLVGGYALGLAATGGSSPTYNFTGASAAARSGLGVIIEFTGIPSSSTPDAAGWAVSVT